MNLIERATVMHFHRHRIASFGAGTVQALGWRGPDSQRARFEAIARAADYADSSVLDVGCGTGDLKTFLDQRCAGLRYLGIDQQPEFIALARERHAGDESAAFLQGDFAAMPLPLVDHVVASGLLGYRSANPLHVAQTIARLFSAARRTLVFNLLDERHFAADHPLLTGRDVDAVLGFCRQLAPEVVRVDGYAADDVTLVMRVAAGG